MNDELRRCDNCGHETTQALAQCPGCGRRLLSVKQLRRLGWAQLFIGLLLVGMLGTIAFNLAPSMLSPGVPDAGGSRFTGTGEQGLLVLGLFGLIIAFGLASMVSGVWQIRTGRRNKRLLYFIFGLVVLLVLAGWWVSKSLGG